MNIHEIPNTIYHNLDFIILNVVFNLIHSDRKMPQPKKPKTEFVPLPDQDVGVVMDALFIAKELPVSNIPTNLEVYQLYQYCNVQHNNTLETSDLVVDLLEKKEN